MPKRKMVGQGNDSPRLGAPGAFKPGSKIQHDERQTSTSWSKTMSSSMPTNSSPVKSSANNCVLPQPPHSVQGPPVHQQLKTPSTSKATIDKTPSSHVSHRSEQIFVQSDKNILRIITEKAPPGVSSRVFKIPKHLHSIYGGDLNLPVSSSERFVYIVKPPASAGKAPIARIAKMSDQEIESALKSHFGNCAQETSEKCMGKHVNLAQPVDHSEITSHKNELTETSLSIAVNDSQLTNEQFCDESSKICENSDVETDNDCCRSENFPKKLKSNIRYGNSNLKSCNLSQPEQVSHNSNSSTEDLTLADSKTEKNPFPSPLLFSQELSSQTKEHSQKEMPYLSTKKPLFKRKEQTKSEGCSSKRDPTAAPTETKLSEEQMSNVRMTAAFTEANLSDEKQIFNMKTTSAKDINSEDKNSDFVEDAEGDKLVLKRKNRRRRSSLKLTNEKKIKRENDLLLDANEADSNFSFSCLFCGGALFDDKIVSGGFCQQKAIPLFLQCGNSDNNKRSGCFFFHTCPETSHLQPLPDGLPGLSLKYIEQEEICVLFMYCTHCLKAWNTEVACRPSPVGAQVKLAAGSGARFKKGQMWLFLHAVDYKAPALG